MGMPNAINFFECVNFSYYWYFMFSLFKFLLKIKHFKYQLYPKSAEIQAFEYKICIYVSQP